MVKKLAYPVLLLVVLVATLAGCTLPLIDCKGEECLYPIPSLTITTPLVIQPAATTPPHPTVTSTKP